MRAAHAEIHQLKEIRKDWAMERDAAVARADKAEKAEKAAKAWVATLIHERGLSVARSAVAEEEASEALDSWATARTRAEKAEAELALAVRLVREWSALYGGTVYEVAGTRELLARHVG